MPDRKTLRRRLTIDHRSRAAVIAARLPLVPLTSLPSFAVIGAQKSGTTSLHAILSKHPDLQFPIVKETRFFDLTPDRSLSWYRAQFPIRRPFSNALAGDATPEYMFFPWIAPTLAGHIPELRAVAIVREPMSRAYSQYQMNIRNEREHLSFADALRAEPERLAQGASTPSSPAALRWSHYSYMERGKYSEQLSHWLDWFPREQLLVLGTRDLADDETATMRRVTDFLGVEPCEPSKPTQRNKGEYHAMGPVAERILEDQFHDEAAKLESVVGHRVNW